MPHDVFISHSSKDKVAADGLCAALENARIRCWIAPRDVLPGRAFSGQIKRAIEDCRVMVLIFSSNSNNSEEVLREVQLAARTRRHIINFRIEDILICDDLDYYLTVPHWLDALTVPHELHYQQLVHSVRALLDLERVAVPGVEALKPPAAEKTAVAGPVAEIPPLQEPDVEGIEKRDEPVEQFRESVESTETDLPSLDTLIPRVLPPVAEPEKEASFTADRDAAPPAPKGLRPRWIVGGLLLVTMALLVFWLLGSHRLPQSRNDVPLAMVDDPPALDPPKPAPAGTKVEVERRVRGGATDSPPSRPPVTESTPSSPSTSLGQLVAIELRVFRGHAESVRAVALSSDGGQLLTGSNDKTAKLWDVQTGKEIIALKGHSDFITAVAFSPNGQHLLTGGYDKTAKLWDAQSGKMLRTFKGHSSSVQSVAFSPDSQQVLTGSGDGSARIWDVKSGKVLQDLQGGGGYVCAAAFSPDGRRVLTGSLDGVARVWDAGTGKVLLTLKGHNTVHSIAYSPDGGRLLTSGRDCTIKLWDAESGKQLFTFTEHKNWMAFNAFSPNGLSVFSGSSDSNKIWDTQTGRVLLTFKDHNDIQAAVFSADGNRVLTGNYDGVARLWELRTAR